MRKVYSRGNINAPIMFIAQVPSAEEVGHYVIEKGTEKTSKNKIFMPIPLCGPAGQVLHNMLNWAGIMEGDFILTNIIKKGTFRPGTDYVRPPTEDEILDDRQNLMKEIVKVNPKLIITLGKEALWALSYSEKCDLDELRIGKNVGVFHDLKVDNPMEVLGLKGDGKADPITYKILPLYHPASVLRDETKEYKNKMSQVMTQNKELISDILGRFTL